MTGKPREVYLQEKVVFVRLDGLTTASIPKDVGEAVEREFSRIVADIVESALVTGQPPDTDFVDAEYTVVDGHQIRPLP